MFWAITEVRVTSWSLVCYYFSDPMSNNASQVVAEINDSMWLSLKPGEKIGIISTQQRWKLCVCMLVCVCAFVYFIFSEHCFWGFWDSLLPSKVKKKLSSTKFWLVVQRKSSILIFCYVNTCSIPLSCFELMFWLQKAQFVWLARLFIFFPIDVCRSLTSLTSVCNGWI